MVKRIINLTVSIHAPTRGATILTYRKMLQLDVSIHAPTRGATAAHRDREEW